MKRRLESSPWPALLLPLLAACSDGASGGDGRVGGACDSCLRTADCAPPLRCREGVCLDPDEPDACTAEPGGDPDAGQGDGRAESCQGLCAAMAATACGAVGSSGTFERSQFGCFMRCSSLPQATIDCLEARVAADACTSDDLSECLGSGEGEGEGPGEGEGEGPAEGEGEGPGEGEGEGGPDPCAEDPASQECRCVTFCRDAIACGVFADVDLEEEGDPLVWCPEECAGFPDATLGCMQGMVDRGTCEWLALEDCFAIGDPGDPEDPPGRQCELFCAWADGCGLLGEDGLAADVPGCQTACEEMTTGDEEMRACLEGLTEAGICRDDALSDCMQ